MGDDKSIGGAADFDSSVGGEGVILEYFHITYYKTVEIIMQVS